MSSDLEFSRRCCNGDRQAWDEFLVKYSRLIYTYLFSSAKTSGKILTEHEKEDLFQELLVSLIDDGFRKLKTYKGLKGCSLASWLRQVTINFMLNRMHRFDRDVASLDKGTESGLTLKDLLIDTAAPVTDASVKQEELGRLTECIERLELDDKYFLELNLGLGLNLEEIREHLGITRGAADMRKSRIVERLRDCFKDKGVILDGG